MKNQDIRQAYVFSGQGAQYPGMGKKLFEAAAIAKKYFDLAKKILPFDPEQVALTASKQMLKETHITQPIIYLCSFIALKIIGNRFKPAAVAGHSLGEFTALVASGQIEFEDGLQLVHQRAKAMKTACEKSPGTMAAIIGLSDETIEEICAKTEGIVVPANYNCPGQLVISGTIDAVLAASYKFKQKGAQRVIPLSVDGAFHSPLMKSAEEEVANAIEKIRFRPPSCPIYQNITAKPEVNVAIIKDNLSKQLTSPVRWTQTIKNMNQTGINNFIEIGPGRVLSNLIRKIDRSNITQSTDG